MLRSDTHSFSIGFNGGIVTRDFVVCTPKAVPCSIIFRSDPRDFSVGFDGYIVVILILPGRTDLDAKRPKARPGVRIIGIDVRNFTIGIYGGIMAVEFVVRVVPEVVIVTVELGVSIAKARPCVGILGLSSFPPPAPFY